MSGGETQATFATGLFCLEVRQRTDGVMPALDPAAPVGGTANADDRSAIRARGTIARLTFGAGHRGITDSGAGHGATPWCYVTKHRSCHDRRGDARQTPIGLTALHYCPRHTRHLIGERDRNKFAWLVLKQFQQPL